MYQLRMQEKGKSIFSFICFLSILPSFQKFHHKAAEAAVTVNFRAWPVLRLCNRGHSSPYKSTVSQSRLFPEDASPSQIWVWNLWCASSRNTQAEHISRMAGVVLLQPNKLRFIDILKVHLNYSGNAFVFLSKHRGSFLPSDFLKHNFPIDCRPQLYF